MSAIEQRGKGSSPFPKQAEQVQVKVLARLTPAIYRDLEKQVMRGVGYVDKDTSPIQAGYVIGLEKVLRVLREGFTTE